MSTHYHVCISIDALERHAIDNTYHDLFLMNDDKPATREQLIESINAARKAGYEVIPPCDNVTAAGHCAGHSDIEEL